MGKVITISREFGSGGHEIARKLSKETGFKMYDNELILEIVRNTNLSEELIKFYDEKPISKTFLPVKTEAISIIDQNIPLEQQIFIAQKEIMIAAAKNDNCIFVGRCANFIFKDYKDSLHFFIYSSLDKRINRKMEILNLSYQETKKIIEKK